MQYAHQSACNTQIALQNLITLISKHFPQALTKDAGTGKAKSAFHWLAQFPKCGSCFEHNNSRITILHIAQHAVPHTWHCQLRMHHATQMHRANNLFISA